MRHLGFLKKINFQFSTTPKNPNTLKTVYKRDLPRELVQFSSEKGKIIFQEALLEGNMETYFPLSEQFNTQSGPPTCGATTLTMVFNALGIDPQRRWKGIWRWWSEDMIEGITQEQLERGMDLEFFTHAAKHNDASIQTFYVDTNNNGQQQQRQQVKERIRGQDYYDCRLNCLQVDHKTANSNTFKTFLVASSRRTGMYFVINNSRKILKQTGDGHFMPIGGINIKRNKALCFDVARFKYPPYWVDIDVLYESLAPFDKSTNRSRGFALISKCFSKFSSLCRISPDYRSLQLISESFKRLLVKQQFQPRKIEESQGQYIKNVLDSLPYDVQVLVAFYIFESLNFIEKQFQQGKKVNKFMILKEQIENMEIFQLLNKQENVKYYRNNELFQLLNDTLEGYATHFLSLILISLPRQITRFQDENIQDMFQREVIKFEDAMQNRRNQELDDQFYKQIKLLRYQIGMKEIEDSLCQYQLQFEKQQQIEIQQDFDI